MLPTPNCSKRNCKHFTGIYQPDDTERIEKPACKAFPEGIPYVIAYGDNKHSKPFPGDNGIQYEQEKPE